ncbi:MAG: PorP/SprF family type IX secretion system membrane protein [Bacteroidales bacterium]|nr:PorP/SprF family type IX secretion system membrane protein [Bacteroidales bacterium]
MKKLIPVILAMMLLSASSRAQDKNILFSQYRFNGLTLNPAYAGSHEVFSASFLGRHQWLGFEGAPKDYALNFHFPGKNTKTGWGGNMIYENIGIRTTMGAYANYAYRILMGSGTLSLGLKAGIASAHQEVLNLSDNDPVFSESTSDYFLPNFGIGLYYYSDKIFAGFSIPLILGYTSNDNGEVIIDHDFSRYTYYLTSGIHLYLQDNWRITPSLLAQYGINSGLVVDGTVSALYRDVFGAGLSYRTSGALIMLLNYRVNYQTTVGLAYDFGFSGINQYNRNSLEIALQIDLGFKINRANPMIF